MTGTRLDPDKTRFHISIRDMLGIVGSVGLAATVVVWFLSTLQGEVSDVKSEVRSIAETMAVDRSNHVTKQEAYINCLEVERANKGKVVCPMAPPLKHVAAPRIDTVKTKRVMVKAPEPKDSAISWPWSSPAVASPSTKGK